MDTPQTCNPGETGISLSAQKVPISDDQPVAPLLRSSCYELGPHCVQRVHAPGKRRKDTSDGKGASQVIGFPTV